MAQPLVCDDLWPAVVPRLPDLAALTGAAFVLTTGTAWERLPVEMAEGSGVTC